MGKGKKKKTGTGKEEASATSQRPPAKEEEAEGDEEASGGQALSRKDKRAAKKAAAKQARVGADVSSGTTAAAASTLTPPESPPAQTPGTSQPESAPAPQQPPPPPVVSPTPQQRPVPPPQVPSPEREFAPPTPGGRGYGRGQGRGERGGGDGDVRPFSPPREAAVGGPSGQWQQQGPQPGRGRGRGRGRGDGGGRGRGGPPSGDAFPSLGAPSGVWRQQQPPTQQVSPTGPPPPQQQQQQQQQPPQQVVPKQQPAPPQQPAQAQKVAAVTDKMKSLSLDTFNIPVRPDINKGGTLGRKTEVDTNHLRLDFRRLKTKTAIHYDVEILPERPKRLFRTVIEEFRKQFFPNRYPAFDGRKNLVASSYLPHLPPGEEFVRQVTVTDVERDAKKDFTVKVKLVNEIDLTCLERYMEEGYNLELPQKAIQMLDIVIRNAPAQRFIQVGRSFFTQPEEPIPLGNGMHMWLGFYQSVILGWKPFLNVDVAHKGFPAPKDVKSIMEEVLGSQYSRFDPDRELNKEQEADLSAFLKGLKVEYKLPNQSASKRTYRVNSAKSSALRLEFKLDDGRQITVAEYFKREKNYTLRYPKLPCLHVGSLNRPNPIFLPVELCTILPGQVTFRKMTEQQTSTMIRYAATSTGDRMQKINTAIHQANFNKDNGIQEFGIVISDQFESVSARILDAPRIAYNNQKEVQPRRGVWRAEHFLRSTPLRNWVIINFGVNIRVDELWSFANLMTSVGSSLGMSIDRPQNLLVMDRRDPASKLYGLLLDCKKSGTELAVVVIDDKRGVYSQVKQFAELKVGVLTQCLKRRTVSRQDRATVSNILLKINSKLNGVNHKLSPPVRPPCLKRPVMIIGADVTHPSPDQRNIPSVAAVCASHDPDAFQYNLQYRLQSPRQEIIQELKEIMLSQLKFFYKKTGGLKPERLIFYRDGVSEGQFAVVLREELNAIKAACRTLAGTGTYEPAITFLVVQKRHHTRFFPKRPEDSDGKNNNVPAGTIVDTKITHPRHIDFYLVSHASIQGVSRPTKYRTLWDDSNMSVDELEQLTYYLCHLFSRCTRSVSYPAPTYYAHLAAYRARTYIEGQPIDLDKLSEEQAQRDIKDNIIKDFPMFFV
ncbi:protein argonaute-2-like [Schistocerca gregaria]|uniref:Argonaute 2 n=2 Tax=Schistocerca gregaria TaxID=7010 RepID=A0A8E5JSZ7_SCHGR|nr:protein argonaute-2-like [Schistocerca gregaria]XP_049838937.1 protein argonaute-2-like [Schistocerca gregaria]XP_049838938.1 protein argonaute-2-like [Schistocerca gregaria]QVD39218.1 Argonaute 2 [Schistocerca gregaria]